MGKAGKERKKRRLQSSFQQNALGGGGKFAGLAADDDSASNSEAESENEQLDHSKAAVSSKSAITTVITKSHRVGDDDEDEDEDIAQIQHQHPSSSVSSPSFMGGVISSEEFTLTIRTLSTFTKHPDLLKLKDAKPLRGALHTLQQQLRVINDDQSRQNLLDGGSSFSSASSSSLSQPTTNRSLSYSARISDALQAAQWEESIQLLRDMRQKGKIPKLGALQRWVRWVDAAGGSELDRQTPTVLRVLDAILRAVDPRFVNLNAHTGSSSSSSGTSGHSAVPSSSSSSLYSPSLPACSTSGGASLQSECILQHPPWVALPDLDVATVLPPLTAQVIEAENARFRASMKVVAHEKGASRRPPNKHDINIYLSEPRTIDLTPKARAMDQSDLLDRRWELQQQIEERQRAATTSSSSSSLSSSSSSSSASSSATSSPFESASSTSSSLHVPRLREDDFSATRGVRRVDCPDVPGAFMLQGVLTPNECRQVIAAAEAMGFEPDEPIAGSKSVLAHNFFWLADSEMIDLIYQRCAPFLPPVHYSTMAGSAADGTNICKLAGINARWHVYRYTPGIVYRPHIDGAWPGSGMRNGRYEYDLFHGAQRSRLTFLLYLNEDFDGGCTTYFLPHAHREGVMDAYAVRPRTGCVMVFPHGDTAGSLLHEGSAVTAGAKYIVRTDVLYTVPLAKP